MLHTSVPTIISSESGESKNLWMSTNPYKYFNSFLQLGNGMWHYPTIILDDYIPDNMELVDMTKIGNQEYLIDSNLNVYHLTYANNYSKSIMILTRTMHTHKFGSDFQMKFLEGVIYCPRCRESI